MRPGLRSMPVRRESSLEYAYSGNPLAVGGVGVQRVRRPGLKAAATHTFLAHFLNALAGGFARCGFPCCLGLVCFFLRRPAPPPPRAGAPRSFFVCSCGGFAPGPGAPPAGGGGRKNTPRGPPPPGR